MRTRDFGMGFFGRGMSGFDGRKNFFEKWSNMTPEEKVAFMDKRVEAMNDEMCGMGNFLRFRGAEFDRLGKEWEKMTAEEKIEFIKQKEDAMKDGCHNHARHFSVEGIDSLCEKWMKMSADEKEQFINERKEAMHARWFGMGGFNHEGDIKTNSGE